MRKHILASTLLPLAVFTGQAADFGNLNVVQLDSGSTPSSVTVSIPVGQATAGFSLAADSTRGLFNIQIGASAADNVANGVLIATVSQNGRDNSAFGDAAGTIFSTTASVASATGYQVAVNAIAPLSTTHNTNVSAAYFPYSEGWIGGRLTPSTGVSSDPNDNFSGSSALTLGIHITSSAPGSTTIDIPGHDARADGILFSTAGAAGGTMAYTTAVSPTSGSFGIVSRGNASDSITAFQQGPVSFVYLPLGIPNVTMATISGDAAATISQGTYTIQEVASGRQQLLIPGQSPSTGTLIVSAVGSSANVTGDNFVTYQPNGAGWEIQVYDTTSVAPYGSLQNVGALQAFSFAFIPFNAAPTSGTVTPVTAFNPDRVAAANYVVDEFNTGNTADSTFVRVSEGSRGMGAIATNRGDNTISFAGAVVDPTKGLLLASVREFKRAVPTASGVSDWGLADVQATVISTAAGGSGGGGTSPLPLLGDEHNVNFAVAYFPNAAGFSQGYNSVTGGSTVLTIPNSGNTTADGLLFATAFGNDDNFATVEPTADGTGFTVHVRDNSSGFEGSGTANSDGANYVYLPYGTTNLIAGKITSSGYIAHRAGFFNLKREGTGLYRLTIPGKNAQTGMLLLNAQHGASSNDNFLVYRADGNDFLIQGIDSQPTGTTATATSYAHLPQETQFQFAYLDFTTPIQSPSLRTNPGQNQVMAMNLTVNQRDSGNAATSVTVEQTFVSHEGFLISNANRGDFDLSLYQDRLTSTNGVVISSVAQLSRDNSAAGDAFGNFFATAGVNDGSTNYFIPLHRAGDEVANGVAAGTEVNINIAAGFFPYSQGWIGGVTQNTAASIIGSPGIGIGTGEEVTIVSGGIMNIALPNTNSVSDGVLLAVSAENASHYAQVSIDGAGGWNVYSHSSTAAGAATTTNDIAFVYIPESRVGVILDTLDQAGNAPWGVVALGRIAGDGTILDGAGNFIISSPEAGKYIITLTNESANLDYATLLLTPGGGETLNIDNFVSYERVGNTWVVETRDLTSLGLEGVGSETAFQFAALAVIPEPATPLMAIAGLSLVALRRRRAA